MSTGAIGRSKFKKRGAGVVRGPSRHGEPKYSTIVAQYEAGLVSAEAVAQAELERDRAQAGLERAEREFTMSLRAFARDLGLDDADGLQLAPLPEELDYQHLSISRDEAVERASPRVASSATPSVACGPPRRGWMPSKRHG